MEPGAARSRHIRMPFLGSEARAAGIANRYQLRTRYRQVYRDVYVPRDAELTAADKAEAAWLWSRRRGVAAGLSASALHGSRWIGDHEPAELNQKSMHGQAGIVLHSDELTEDEICLVRGYRPPHPPGLLSISVVVMDSRLQSFGSTLCSRPRD